MVLLPQGLQHAVNDALVAKLVKAEVDGCDDGRGVEAINLPGEGHLLQATIPIGGVIAVKGAVLLCLVFFLLVWSEFFSRKNTA
ncbi:hypothetical protein WV31_05525 [Magnetospirillum sp. ME-1]|nr:hypothetical protein WV31_05525 [Magnetospirillum sp. ME-1]